MLIKTVITSQSESEFSSGTQSCSCHTCPRPPTPPVSNAHMLLLQQWWTSVAELLQTPPTAMLILLCKKINICLGGQRIFVEPQKDPSCIPNHGWQTSQMFSNLPTELLEAVPASLPILLPCSQHRPCFYPKLNFHLQHSETRKKYGCVFNTPHILHVSFAVGIFTMNQQWKFTRQEDTVCSSASSKCTSLQSFKQILLIFISPPVSLFI